MTAFDRFEQLLPALLDDLAVVQMPDYAEDLLARTAATRQRRGWTFPERWFPMSALTRRLAAAPQVPLRLAVALALLVAAALIGALVAGSFTPHRPAPFGPAANGQIAYIDGTGQIAVGDPVTGTSNVIISGTGNSRVSYSLDGSRLAFTRAATGGGVDLMVANPDGSHVTKVTPDPITDPSFMAWSPRGDRIAITTLTGALLLFDASRAAEPTDLSQKLGVGVIQIGGYTDQPADVFRPPNGDELLFETHDAGARLQTAHLDGNVVETVLDPTTSRLGYSNLRAAQWSADGSQIAVMVEFPSQPERWHIYVLDADGGNVRPLSSLSKEKLIDQGRPTWSPNGTQIAFQYWTDHPADTGVDVHPIGVVDVTTGHFRELGPTLINGATWAWSPDGLSILEVPAAPTGDGHILIINAATGLTQTAPWTNVAEINWQRTLP
jgi:Tol biopolymer transport system component